MTIASHHPLLHGGVSPNGPLAHAHSTQRSHEVAAQATQTSAGVTPHTETKFLPLHVFNHWVMNMMGNNVPRRTSLQERRERSKQAKSGKTRRGSETSVNDAIVAVAGRARAAAVSLTPNLLRDPGGGDQYGWLETQGRAREKKLAQRPHLYMKTAENGGQTGVSPEDANRMFQDQDGNEAGQTAVAVAMMQEWIKEKFPTWSELRQAMQNPKKLEEEIDPKTLEKLKTVTSRELRSGAVRVHTTVNGFVSELSGLGITMFLNRLVGPENCEQALIASRRMLESRY